MANDDVRQKYRELDPVEKADVAEIKQLGQALIDKCKAMGQSRELSLAVTNAEQAVMWGVKHVTR